MRSHFFVHSNHFALSGRRRQTSPGNQRQASTPDHGGKELGVDFAQPGCVGPVATPGSMGFQGRRRWRPPVECRPGRYRRCVRSGPLVRQRRPRLWLEQARFHRRFGGRRKFRLRFRRRHRFRRRRTLGRDRRQPGVTRRPIRFWRIRVDDHRSFRAAVRRRRCVFE